MHGIKKTERAGGNNSGKGNEDKCLSRVRLLLGLEALLRCFKTVKNKNRFPRLELTLDYCSIRDLIQRNLFTEKA